MKAFAVGEAHDTTTFVFRLPKVRTSGAPPPLNFVGIASRWESVQKEHKDVFRANQMMEQLAAGLGCCETIRKHHFICFIYHTIFLNTSVPSPQSSSMLSTTTVSQTGTMDTNQWKLLGFTNLQHRLQVRHRCWNWVNETNQARTRLGENYSLVHELHMARAWFHCAWFLISPIQLLNVAIVQDVLFSTGSLTFLVFYIHTYIHTLAI